MERLFEIAPTEEYQALDFIRSRARVDISELGSFLHDHPEGSVCRFCWSRGFEMVRSLERRNLVKRHRGTVAA